jgi:hypothetical protein
VRSEPGAGAEKATEIDWLAKTIALDFDESEE